MLNASRQNAKHFVDTDATAKLPEKAVRLETREFLPLQRPKCSSEVSHVVSRHTTRFCNGGACGGCGLARAADALSGPHAVDAHTPATAGLEWRNRHPEMRYRRLGRTGFMISEIVCGGDPIAPDNNRHVEAAIDCGISASLRITTPPTCSKRQWKQAFIQSKGRL